MPNSKYDAPDRSLMVSDTMMRIRPMFCVNLQAAGCHDVGDMH